VVTEMGAGFATFNKWITSLIYEAGAGPTKWLNRPEDVEARNSSRAVLGGSPDAWCQNQALAADSFYILTVAWTGNDFTARAPIEEVPPGFSQTLETFVRLTRYFQRVIVIFADCHEVFSLKLKLRGLMQEAVAYLRSQDILCLSMNMRFTHLPLLPRSRPGMCVGPRTRSRFGSRSWSACSRFSGRFWLPSIRSKTPAEQHFSTRLLPSPPCPSRTSPSRLLHLPAWTRRRASPRLLRHRLRPARIRWRRHPLPSRWQPSP